MGSQRHAKLAYRKNLRAGGDPTVRGRAKPAGTKTFKEAAIAFFAEHGTTLTGAKAKAQWMPTMVGHVFPALGKTLVNEIGVPEVRKTLMRIWSAKPATALIVRMRIGQVLDWATVNKYRTGDNPIKALIPGKGMPTQIRAVRHHPALPHEDVCQFLSDLCEGQSSAAKLAFQFLILTACRSNEALGARWDEINEAEHTWTVPSVRMKGERRKRNPRPHVVLLSDRAIEILKAAKGLDGPEFIFPSPRSRRRSLSTNAFDGYIDSRGMTGKVSAHGFRSSFKRWAGTETNFDKDAIEIALAHTVGDAVEGAYWRNDPMIKKRRALMQAWSDYVTGRTANADDVVALRVG